MVYTYTYACNCTHSTQHSYRFHFALLQLFVVSCFIDSKITNTLNKTRCVCCEIADCCGITCETPVKRHTRLLSVTVSSWLAWTILVVRFLAISLVSCGRNAFLFSFKQTWIYFDIWVTFYRGKNDKIYFHSIFCGIIGESHSECVGVSRSLEQVYNLLLLFPNTWKCQFDWFLINAMLSYLFQHQLYRTESL